MVSGVTCSEDRGDTQFRGCEVRVSRLHLPEKVGGKGIGGTGEQCVCTSFSRLGLRVCTSLTSEGWGLRVLPVDLLHPLSPERELPKRNGLVFCVQQHPARLGGPSRAPTTSPSSPQKFISVSKHLFHSRVRPQRQRLEYSCVVFVPVLAGEPRRSGSAR